MDAFSDFFPQLLVVALVLSAAVGAAPLAARFGVPGPAAFLAVGVLAGAFSIGPIDQIGDLPLQQLGAVALYIILFQGGLSTGITATRRHGREILLLGLPGTALTAGGIAVIGRLIGLEWELAILVGVALAPTDPAAVYATLRGGGRRSGARTILEGESGFNDPVGISFMVVALAAIGPDGATFGEGALRLLEELGIGLLGGLVGGSVLIAILRMTPRLEEGLQGAAMILAAIAVGAATATLHGSGFLAVFISGLLLSDTWTAQDGPHRPVSEGLAGLAEPLLFGVLGAHFAAQVGWNHIWQGLVLTLATLLIVRPPIAFACTVGSGLSRAERVLVSWGGLKGAVPLLLAAYPALEDLSQTVDTESIVLVATAASVLIQGLTLKYVAARIGPGGVPGDVDAGIVPGHAQAGG